MDHIPVLPSRPASPRFNILARHDLFRGKGSQPLRSCLSSFIMRAKPAPINTTEAADAASRGFSIDAHRLVAPKLAAGLYLVATPIGNLGDITLRALQTLAAADVICCEDTRITRRLTERYDISAQLKQYHEHNAEAARPKI